MLDMWDLMTRSQEAEFFLAARRKAVVFHGVDFALDDMDSGGHIHFLFSMN